MEVRLAPVDAELAAHILRQVEYPVRLVGMKMSAMGGSNPTELYSLEDVARFIHIDDYEVALRDNQATVGYVDPKALSRWLSEVLGDAELAEAVLEVAGEGSFYGKIALSVKELLLDRIAQCRASLADEEAASAVDEPGDAN